MSSRMDRPHRTRFSMAREGWDVLGPVREHDEGGGPHFLSRGRGTGLGGRNPLTSCLGPASQAQELEATAQHMGSAGQGHSGGHWGVGEGIRGVE